MISKSRAIERGEEEEMNETSVDDSARKEE